MWIHVVYTTQNLKLYSFLPAKSLDLGVQCLAYLSGFFQGFWQGRLSDMGPDYLGSIQATPMSSFPVLIILFFLGK